MSTRGDRSSSMSPTMHRAATTRRTFLRSATAGVAGALTIDLGTPAASTARTLPLRLEPSGLTGKCARLERPALLPAAVWYDAPGENDGLEYRFEAGALAGMRFLTADLLVDSADLPVFQLRLHEGSDGPAFTLTYALLPHAEARLRMAAEAVSQNRWQFLREGAWLKPMAGGARVDLAQVDRITLVVLRKSPQPVQWCQTALTAMADEPPRLTEPRLPRGRLLDELGQSTTRDWPGRTGGVGELTERLTAQLAAASSHR